MERTLGLARFATAILLLSIGVSHAADAPGKDARLTFVIVHGGWGGSWALRPIEQRLRAQGFEVYRPALLGSAESAHLPVRAISLETHIQQIVNLIRYEDLHDIVLVGYSYSGMVVTGVADRIPDRIRHLIYLDALLPENGESTMTFAKQMRSPMAVEIGKHITAGKKAGVVPAFWEKPGVPPPKQDAQSYRTFTEPIRLTQRGGSTTPGTFVQFVAAGTKAEDADFFVFAERARKRGWPVRVFVGEHSAPFQAPAEIANLVMDIAGGPARPPAAQVDR
jgi:pimeloyl-ACP methyl ester carboxylesterase